MGSGRDNYGWEQEQDKRAARKKESEWKFRRAHLTLSNLEGQTPEGDKWEWLIENMDKCYRNRKLIELLG